MQNTIEAITLYYKSGSSDKIYQASIEPAGNDLYTVNFAYGRRGNTLQAGTKTQSPVPYDKAKAIYDRLVKSKTAKGYTPGEDGTPYVGTGERKDTGIHCQLLNPIEESNLAHYLDNPLFLMQEKFDGRRLLLLKRNGEITGINRRGLETGLPEPVARCAASLPGDFIIDGEAVGDLLHAFDLLEIEGHNLRSNPYRERFGRLTLLLAENRSENIIAVDTAATVKEKQAMLDRIRQTGGEGVVLKDCDAPYVPGRPASGGTQLKHKFYKSASCVVIRSNGDRRSVSLGLLSGECDSDDPVGCGSVTIPVNHEILSAGDVVEVRYLYAYPESNSLCQPVYLGTRKDIPISECLLDQLSYKAA